jgi:DNA-binding SARP family transcriptional activator/class 3 adenylate cyclase
MDFRLLGPLEVFEGERKLALGGPKQRAVLAHVVLRANAVVAIDLLIDAVWGDEPPAAARRTLQAYVSRLRNLLGEQRLEGRGGGYVLTCTPEEIDAARFDLLVKRGKGSIASDPVAAAGILSEALAIWRGGALADLAGETSLRGEITRLEEMRLSATEYLLSAELAAGRDSTIVGRLEVLTERYPMRERLWASLMLALYRSGRQGDALVAYQEVRRVLADELGIDPSPELQHLNGQILRQDPLLRSPLIPGHPLGEASTDRLTGLRAPPTAGTDGGLLDVPEVRYAKTSAGVHIAYLVVGAGPVDLLWPGDSFSNLDALSDLRESGRFLQRLGSIARLITFDPRGTGLSDRISERQLPTLETRMADAVAVMDAAGSTRTALLGADATGSLAILFAATYPERTSALILYSTYASGRWSPDYPWAWSEDEWDASLKEMDEQWGEPAYSEELVELLAPSALADPETINRFIRFFRSAASPSTAVAIERMERDTDVREILPAVHVPTLVLHRIGSKVYDVGEARYLAEHISGARLVELDGVDHLPWFGETDPIVREIDRFIGSVLDEEGELDRVLATVMFTDIVGWNGRASQMGEGAWRQLLVTYHERVRGLLARYRGRQVDTPGDGFLATFDGPARAIRCAVTVAQAMHDLGLEVGVGLHTGEIELEGDGVQGIAVHIGTCVASLAGPDEVLVSSTVKDLVAGSGLTFEDRGEHELKGVPGPWRLYRVVSGSP